MPFLRQFMAAGFLSRTGSTPHPLTPPAWTTLFTGRNPGAHGVYDFMRVDDRQHEVFFTLYDFRDIRCETLWSLASRQQRPVVALNFPMMAPPPALEGSSLSPASRPGSTCAANASPGRTLRAPGLVPVSPQGTGLGFRAREPDRRGYGQRLSGGPGSAILRVKNLVPGSAQVTG